MRLIIVSGMSGSGKSVVLQRLEDLGYRCVDNMPAALLAALVRDRRRDPLGGDVAVSIDARARAEEVATIPDLLRELRGDGVRCELVFITADAATLLKRYSETRRPHPLGREGVGLGEAIALERKLLSPIAQHADLQLDTSRTRVAILRDMVRDRIHRAEVESLSVQIESFGFKHGVPSDADMVFDVRSLPNPFWDPSLRPLTGRDAAVIEYLERQNATAGLLEDMRGFLERRLAEFDRSDRSYLTVAIGCTGGQHRSVYMVEALATHLRAHYANLNVRHLELGS